LKCYICKRTDLTEILDLGNHPPPLILLSENELKTKSEPLFPLKLFLCEECGLVQLDNAVDPELLFRDYSYTSSASVSFKNHLHSFAKEVVEKYRLTKNDLVIDIASNDGTLLQGFLSHDVKVLGIEPSNVAKLAEEKGVTTVNDFFDEKIANEILQKYGKAKIITATNVFAHIHKLDSLMNGIKVLLDDDGSFISENHYLKDLIEKLEYDTIYHEHLRYYGLSQLVTLFEKYDMEVYHVERIPTHGGSIRVFACQKNTHEITSSVVSLLMEEKEMRLTSKQTLLDFAEKVHENKSELLHILKKLQSEGKKVVGISAPARSCTVLNFCNIDSSLLNCITESSSLKIGKFTPGTHIPIKSDSFLNDEQPDYALLLSWHLKDSIVPKLRQNGFKGKFIIPLPSPKII
jgi:sulfur relay (sulfurtransferase) DsrF/TusC family protein